MANSTTNLDTISAGQSAKEVTANDLFDALSPASLFGRRASTTAGLTWGYYGGTLSVGGVLEQIANGTVTLTNGATNYLEYDSASSPTGITKNTSGFTGGTVVPLYSIVVSGGAVTSYTDWRRSGLDAGGGGGAAVYQVALHYTSDTGSTADSDPGNGLFKWNNATQASATQLYLDNLTEDGVDLTTYFAALPAGGFVQIVQADDQTKWQLWKWTAVTAAAGYYKFTVTLQASAGSIPDAESVYFIFTPNPPAGVGGGGTSPADVQTFTGSGTWTKPSGAKVVRVICYGGGGGGGGGESGVSAANARSGAGGGGAARVEMVFDAADLASSVSVTIGAGGAGGAAGTVGTAGGQTTFGSHLSAYGGGGGGSGAGTAARGGGCGGGSAGVGQNGGTGNQQGGLPSSATNAVGQGTGGGGSGTASAQPAEYGGGAGGFNATGVGGAGGTSIFGSAGGGGGGGVATSVAQIGGAGGGVRTYVNAGGGGGAGGSAPSGTGTAGTAATIGTGATGGGGGGGVVGSGGGTGGAGGAGGGGGGGGGGASNGTGGTGGAGGAGKVFVISW